MCARVAWPAWSCGPSTSPLDGAAVVTLNVIANIDVDDLTRATEFYCSALDLRVGRRFGSPAVELLGVVPDVLAAVARAMSAGASLEGEVETHAWGRIASMADPFGHGFCFIEFLGCGYDEIAS